MVFVVGNGRRVRFWLDKWCGDESLKDTFPSLFALATSKDAWVEEVCSGSFEGFVGLLALLDIMIGSWRRWGGSF